MWDFNKCPGMTHVKAICGNFAAFLSEHKQKFAICENFESGQGMTREVVIRQGFRYVPFLGH